MTTNFIGQPAYYYKAKILNVVDGDTIDVDLDLGFYIHSHQRMRLNGLDTPELNSQDPAIRQKAQEAKDYVKQFIGQEVLIASHKVDKYGRFLAEVFFPTTGLSLNESLIELGYAVPYDGGKR